MRVVEFEPPHRLRWREEDRDAVFNVLYELKPDGAGTRITQVDDIDWKIPTPLRPVGRIMVSRDIKRQFASLRRLLEGTASGEIG
jgi:Polyketide cyclase / dehydrase and lipid transport